MADQQAIVHGLLNGVISMTLNNPYPAFKVMPLFDAECLRNGMRYRHSYSEIPIGTYTQGCDFK